MRSRSANVAQWNNDNAPEPKEAPSCGASTWSLAQCPDERGASRGMPLTGELRGSLREQQPPRGRRHRCSRDTAWTPSRSERQQRRRPAKGAASSQSTRREQKNASLQQRQQTRLYVLVHQQPPCPPHLRRCRLLPQLPPVPPQQQQQQQQQQQAQHMRSLMLLLRGGE